ncbi:sulfurtransferase [Brachyspira hyodysenteriae]|uniref:tRNA 2-selenouridine(34) synthase MnmH n=1 Tax=Brachyspira hyodysenteriae ATCC 27164 TaxID=1266923 RepID=A0A3B6W5X1_BRAHO|nr:tRNA 2-selenouridine(34) synthase MnmH [Brachyspira hyodysenteriae]ANN62471.1 tRNA 2-selenouridine(34) synthase MnmH [Brachyspira hyodysenteriae ATCC 27164]AUJ48687.1 tRNA 2-selenouridine synthase [Brachyspira hyodysenteriae]KLI28792.1 sulfurtransferase [Brachyspira hyodysenteriae]KLI54372.1 sulfurtransferase [Brachyspira hyodysenteriae]MCZ9885414.1 tRNA 2-selenouridine(34) synthase MnmH [Brachyspira hyodysenteriae]
MVKVIDIEEFLKFANYDELPIIDVRSPIEYNHAHIPNAHNVYLFNDEERKDVGTIYKQIGRKEAILKGLEYVSVRMTSILKTIDEIAKKYNSTNKILMHCFRGGMRSESTAWLCSSYGYEVYVLKGGYKRYRNYVLDSFERDYKIYLLTGRTGSGKTLILNKLKSIGYNVIDLEQIAKHKGSAFGWINEGEQPSQEQFENNLSYELLKYDIDSTLWFEDESLLIGRRAIPKSLFNKMREAEKIIYLDIPKECRAEYIVNTYGKYSIDDLKESILKIKKRLGGERLKESLELLDNGNIYECVLNMLYYYDKAYKLSINENKLVSIKCTDNNFDNIVQSIIREI